MEKDKRLMEASSYERLTEGETGSCSDEQGVLSKSLIQISVEGWSCVPSLLFTYVFTLGLISSYSFKLLSSVCLQPEGLPAAFLIGQV